MSHLLDIITAHRQGQPVGIYSVCSANEYVLRAAFEQAKRYGTPLLIESTSNQVDQFGGYTGMNPVQFRSYVLKLAQEEGFAADRLLLGGDHLGPNAWQHLPAAEAMAFAAELIRSYVAAGFEKIHLDCSMACSDDPKRLPDEIVAERSAVLAAVAERAALEAGLAPPVYVIGTEVPIPGGEASLGAGVAVTSPAAAAATLAVHAAAFAAHGLQSAWQRVIAMVVQPGVDFDHSQIQHYAPQAAANLSKFVAQQMDPPALVFEAHSTDYQTEAAMHALVRDHFAILKVGPAVTFALREAWFALAAIEREIVPFGRQSQLPAVLEQRMLAEPKHWAKHYSGTPAQQHLLRAYALSDRCRYYWGDAAVQAAVAKLIANLEQQAIALPLLSQYLPEQFDAVLRGELAATPRALAQHKVGVVLARYARACSRNRHGLGESMKTPSLSIA
ncbi:D-tagatose-bisphosphate aldolase, class II, non-catalytic subunit [Paucibacter sp. B2R-40]|jgi:D-tagatose-1,6-bisphosphate aldolase subunit GatZ/KbaZ|uniref:D-tagatose-bisphosphate aldolase, class II, non-catalytic subunit n=1 Tax=Paucibacter sp. B2R-40 TaxID=2893554 RepID=UPI0021E3B02C|nr:D-tagatose-bisphosphate aldolase, class II, non-catalytic subunit [Paucibacter sp. B2R-40]MCV2353499.1 D-tagatose-bisphosphate aldolase, class II, non-catalytic subunit [Paucibacter sp. B2R-40]